MKKIIVCICSILVIILAIFFGWFVDVSKERRLTKNYNLEYETYTKDNITGVELTSLLNKAINNNEQYSIPRDDKNFYIADKEYSITILVKLVDDGKFYKMEAFEKAGITKFNSLYGMEYFKCIDKKYHENGRISEISFEIVN